jgi:two-component system LytT family response regulator
VELEGRQGFEIMKHVPSTTSVILTTAHEIYAFDGYEIGAIDFLKKPLNKERFTKAVNKVIPYHSATASPVYITISSGKQVYRFRKEEIYSVESVKDYVRVTTNNSNQLFLCTMKYLEELLEPLGFLRISKSCIINQQHITHVKGAQVNCSNGECFSIGRSFRQKVTSALERSGNTGTH